jgi:hypothetical protein
VLIRVGWLARALTIGCALIASSLMSGDALAATIPVACSGTTGSPAALNTAVTNANATTTADTIDITGGPCTFSYTAIGGPGAAGAGNDSALPIVTQPLTILGHGSTITRASAAPNMRLLLTFNAAGSPAVDLHDLTFTGGKLTGTNVGAGIATLGGSLTLDNVVVATSTTVNGNGGGVWAQTATVLLDNSIVIGNTASGAGGGGAAFISSAVTIDHTQFQSNSAANAGGLYLVAGTATVRRSAFILNGATGSSGSAIVQGGSATFQNDTFASNSGANGIGGVAVDNNATTQGTATIENSTFADNSVALNTAPGGAVFTCVGAAGSACGSGTPPVVHVHNTIVTDTDSTAAAVLAPCSSSFGGSIISDGGNIEYPTNTCAGAHANPLLSPLIANNGNTNGGKTFNYRLLPGSPAIDLGTSPCPATDQRDKVRPGGDGCDAGAYETHPPQTSATGPSSPTNNPQVTFSSDQAGSTFQCSVDNGSFFACTSPTTPVVGDGAHTFAVRATAADPTSTNTATNSYTDASPASVSFTVDKTLPVVQITPLSSPTNDNTPTIAFTVTDASSTTTTCKVDLGAPAPCSSPFTTNTLSDAIHTVTVFALDAAGNTGQSSTTFTVDTTAPVTTISGGPSGAINVTSAAWTFGANEPSTFECKLDAGFVPCASPATYNSLTPGSHSFQVRATDTAGNTDATPDTRTIVVDTVAPVVHITVSPTSPTNDNTATIEFTVDDNTATVTCKVDANNAAPCSSPFTTSALNDGSHTITVSAVDAAGNFDDDAVTFTVDATAPDTNIDTGPSGTIIFSSATFEFSSPDASATFECRLGGGGFSPCSSPQNYSGFAAGTYTFEVRARDAAGNIDATPASRTFTYTPDLSAPVVVITESPASPTADNTATIKFTVDEPADIKCKVDNGALSPCASPFTTGTLNDGEHTILVRATDPSTNVGEASVTFIVDTAPPDVTITQAPPSLTNDDTPSIEFTVDDNSAALTCKVDATDPVSCSSPFTTGTLNDGSHTIVVRARDGAGNFDEDSRTFTVDATPPDTSITGGPSGPINVDSASFTFTSPDGGATFQCKLDTGDFEPCASPKAYANLSETAHTFQVRAVDAAGNIDPLPATRSFNVDKTAPIVTIGAVTTPTNDTTPTITFSVNDGTATTRCKVDTAADQPCSSPFTTVPLAPGSHTITVFATDPAGNTGQAATTIVVDTSAPDTTITAAPAALVHATTATYAATFAFMSSEPGSTFECRMDTGAFAACSSPKTYNVAPGGHTFAVRAIDAAGNIDPTPATRTFTYARCTILIGSICINVPILNP